MTYLKWQIAILLAALAVAGTWILTAGPGRINYGLGVPLDKTAIVKRIEALEDGRIVPRAFERWSPENPLPCYPAPRSWLKQQNRHVLMSRGLFYTKLHKCASTTSASVHLRIARNLAMANNLRNTVCTIYFSHNVGGRSDGMPPYGYATRFGQRDRTQSFLWTTIREPTNRYISHYFYSRVSKAGKNYTDTDFVTFLSNHYEANGSYYLHSMNTQGFRPNRDDPALAIQQILQDYDFIAISERFAESVVALMMILGLDIGDMLFVDSKSHFADSAGFNHPGVNCFKIVDAYVTPTMQHLFETNQKWKETIYWDEVMYSAASMSLDLTIDRLGREEFAANLDLFRKASRAAHFKCQEQAAFTCPPNRTTMDCVGTDIACGQQCLDTVVKNLGLNISFDVANTQHPYVFSTTLAAPKQSSKMDPCRTDPSNCRTRSSSLDNRLSKWRVKSTAPAGVGLGV